jgi:outer membrane protein OmpA-like peptidoglycan-associated protein
MNSNREPKKEATMPCNVSSHAFRFSPAATRRWAYAVLCGLSLAVSMTPASAEELTVDEMACALDPQCTMPFVDRRLRGVTSTPSVRTPGSFDRTVNFPFNSSELTPDARKALDDVAASLNRPNVAKYEIVISGHTDAVGSDDYNQQLSERRAEAARQYLISRHGISASRLVAKGYGKSQLLLPSEPTSELNRRVQFLNPSYTTASTSTPAPTQAASSPAPQQAPTPAAQPDGL